MRSPMIELLNKRERRIVWFQTIIAGIILVSLFVGLGLLAVEGMPDPSVTYSVTESK